MVGSARLDERWRMTPLAPLPRMTPGPAAPPEPAEAAQPDPSTGRLVGVDLPHTRWR